MFQLIEQLRLISTKHNLKLAPEESFFMLLKVIFLGHEISCNTIKPIQSKVDAIHQNPFPTSKVALMIFIGALNFLQNSLKNSILILNLLMTHYMRILCGHGLLNMKVYFTS